MNRRKLVMLTAGVALAGASALSLARAEEVYRWVDQNGVVNYAERPPESGGARIEAGNRPLTTPARNAFLEPLPPPPVPPPGALPGPAGDTPPAPEADPRMAELEAQRLARAEELEAERRQKCQQMRTAFDRLTQTDRIRIKDATGYERIMGEDERQTRIDRAERGILNFCDS